MTKVTENGEERPALDAVARRSTTAKQPRTGAVCHSEQAGGGHGPYGCLEDPVLELSTPSELRLAYELREEEEFLRLRTNSSHQKIAGPEGHWDNQRTLP